MKTVGVNCVRVPVDIKVQNQYLTANDLTDELLDEYIINTLPKERGGIEVIISPDRKDSQTSAVIGRVINLYRNTQGKVQIEVMFLDEEKFTSFLLDGKNVRPFETYFDFKCSMENGKVKHIEKLNAVYFYRGSQDEQPEVRLERFTLTKSVFG